MAATKEDRLVRLGFTRVPGTRLYWKRTGSALDICRKGGATKHQDLGEGHPALPSDTLESNAQWARDLAADPLTDWHA